MTRARILLVCAAVVCLAQPVAIHAAGNKPSPAQMAKAKDHYQRAQTYKGLKDYRKAAEEFLLAYQSYANAEFYFNAAEMYRLDGDTATAVKYFRLYLAKSPEGRVSHEARTSLRELELVLELEQKKREAESANERAARLERERAEAKQKEASRLEAERQERERAAAELAAGREREAAAREREAAARERELAARQREAEAHAQEPASAGANRVTSSVAEPVESGGSGGSLGTAQKMRYGSYAAGAVGLLSVGLGIKFGLDALSAADQLSEKYDPDLESSGRASERKMFFVYGVGAAALVTGGILYYLGGGRGEPREQALSAVPVMDGERTGLVFTGSF